MVQLVIGHLINLLQTASKGIGQHLLVQVLRERGLESIVILRMAAKKTCWGGLGIRRFFKFPELLRRGGQFPPDA
jgi:hypothetical protein